MNIRLTLNTFRGLAVRTLGALIVIMTASCDSNNNDSARLSVSVKDAPIDSATSVVVEFTGIELKPQQGPGFSIDFQSPRQIDLLDFQGTDAAQLFENVAIEPGEYNWMRLKVNAIRQTLDSYIEFDDGSMHSLYIPSGSQTGLKWNQGFTAPANGNVDFTVDFDLRKSIHLPANAGADYFLRPVIRVLDNTQVGHIEGSVDSNLITGATCGEAIAVYLFDDSATPIDDEGSANPPQTSAMVTTDENNNLVYALGYILPGDYRLGLTCQADNDDPETDDDIEFIDEASATVVANETTTVNF